MSGFDEEAMMHARTRCMRELASIPGASDLMIIVPMWVDLGRAAYRCELGKGGDGIVTRWCATPDLAVDAALAGATAMAAVFEGGG